MVRVAAVRREACRHGSWHPVEYPVKTMADVRAMRHVYAWSEYWVERQTMDGLERVVETYKHTALPATGLQGYAWPCNVVEYVVVALNVEC